MLPRFKILLSEDGDVDVWIMAMNDGEENSLRELYGKVSHLVDGIEFVLNGDTEC